MSVDIPRVAPALLAWYDANARRLLWRSPPGCPAPDPYRVWLSEIMLQQTTVAAVTPYFERFTARWPTLSAFAVADEAEVMSAWAGLGYYARARNLVACARAVATTGFPKTEAELARLPGIGRYTAAAIAAIAFDKRAVVVDGNVERVVARLFAVETPLPSARPQLRALTARLTPPARSGDFAQAMMDLGATICMPKAPACPRCPLSATCSAAASDLPASYPRRAPKAAKPERTGTAWWIARGSDVRLVRRPASGLLAGMRALPTGGWDGAPPLDLGGVPLGRVVHVFTHFRLSLEVRRLPESGCAALPDGEWWPVAALHEAGLPTLFARAAGLATREDLLGRHA